VHLFNCDGCEALECLNHTHFRCMYVASTV
jgi:hypothetical protein